MKRRRSYKGDRVWKRIDAGWYESTDGWTIRNGNHYGTSSYANPAWGIFPPGDGSRIGSFEATLIDAKEEVDSAARRRAGVI